MGITKPAVRQSWADAATIAADISDPGGLVATGWQQSSTPPARAYFNWVLNYCFNGIRYFSRRGIPDWDASETYLVGDITQGPDGVLYRSIQNNNNAHTPSNSPSWWSGLPYASSSDVSGNYATVAYVNANGNAAIANANAHTDNALQNYVPMSYLTAHFFDTNGTANYVAAQNFATVPFVQLTGQSAVAQAQTFTNNALQNYPTNAVFNQNILNLEAYANNSSAAAHQDILNQTDANPSNNTIVRRTAQGYVNGTYFNQSSAHENQGAISAVYVEVNNDGYHRKYDPSTFISNLAGISARTTPGWSYLPGGMLIQFGIVTIPASGGITVTFPKPFTASCGVVLTPIGLPGIVSIQGQSINGFTCDNDHAQAAQHNWIAMGY